MKHKNNQDNNAMNRKKTAGWQKACILTTTLLALAACASDNDEAGSIVIDEHGTRGVKPEFVISIPRSVINTRMSDDVTQNQGLVSQFRGLDHIRLLSFGEVPTATSPKLAEILSLSAIHSLASAGRLNYKVYADEFVPVGTRNFLFYAKAIDAESEQEVTQLADKFHYGVLKATGLTESEFSTPADISFSLEQISADAQFDTTKGQALLTLLNTLANTTVPGMTVPYDAWSTSPNARLKSLYQRFTGLTTSASANVAAVLGQLYTSLHYVNNQDVSYPLASALIQTIADATTGAQANGQPLTLKTEYQGYPGSAGLPEGAASIRWNAATHSFVAATANYNGGLRADISQYAFPAALWYHVSTPLKASTKIESPNYDSEGSWNGVIEDVYATASDVVQSTTQSVALRDPAQYGVGRLETRIFMDSGTFYDGDGQPVATGSGYTLLGMLIGGQNSVGFDFTSKGNENLTIYDRDVVPGIVARSGMTTAANQTLALETKSNQVINVALELRNGGEPFKGADGIIPAGGTFYLTARLNPTTAVNYADGVLDKIFMQDHVTKLTITIHNGQQTADRNGDGWPDQYLKDENGTPYGVDANGDGYPDLYDIDGDGEPDAFITDPANGGPGWDTDGDGLVDRPVIPNEEGIYPDSPNVPEGLGNATMGVPDLSSPYIELGTSVDLEWQEGLILNPGI